MHGNSLVPRPPLPCSFCRLQYEKQGEGQDGFDTGFILSWYSIISPTVISKTTLLKP